MSRFKMDFGDKKVSAEDHFLTLFSISLLSTVLYI